MSDITEEFENISAFDRYSLIRSAFRRVVHWASYNFILTSRRQRRVRVFDLQLYVPPSVFHPGVFLTSRMFARFLRTLDLRGKRVVEIGTGSGILAISAAKAGASLVVALDINPKAVAAAIRNANDNNVGACFSARTSDLFSAVSRQEKFDVVISSPRSFEGEPLDMADRAWHAGPGYRDIRALFQQAQGHLDMGGIMYLLLSSDTNVKYLKQKAFEAGFDWDLVTRKSIVVESFLIFRLNKRTTRSHQFTETSAKERAVVATPSPQTIDQEPTYSALARRYRATPAIRLVAFQHFIRAGGCHLANKSHLTAALRVAKVCSCSGTCLQFVLSRHVAGSITRDGLERTTNIQAKLMLDGTPALARKPLSPTITATLALGAALAAAALVVQYRKQKAEKENPPQGAFIGVGGCQASLHRGGAG